MGLLVLRHGRRLQRRPGRADGAAAPRPHRRRAVRRRLPARGARRVDRPAAPAGAERGGRAAAPATARRRARRAARRIPLPRPGGRGAAGERWCAIAVFDDAEWRRCARAMGRPEWATDERFANLALRLAHEPVVDALVAEWTSRATRRTSSAACRRRASPPGWSPTRRDLCERDAHLRARGYWATVRGPGGEPLVYDGVAARLSNTPGFVAAAGAAARRAHRRGAARAAGARPRGDRSPAPRRRRGGKRMIDAAL